MDMESTYSVTKEPYIINQRVYNSTKEYKQTLCVSKEEKVYINVVFDTNLVYTLLVADFLLFEYTYTDP